MQHIDPITLTLILILAIIITKQYFQHTLRKKTQHITNLEKQLLSKDELLLHNIKLACLGKLLINITHLWRQPLSVINAVGSNINMQNQLGVLEDSEINRYVGIIERNTMKLSSTIDDFSILFQNSSCKSSFEISQSFTHVTDILQPQIYDANIQIKISLLDTQIHTYKSELMQVFMHILNNSIEILCCHKSKQNYIFATIRNEEKNTIIQIYDNAFGIAQEYLDDVFEMHVYQKEDNNQVPRLYMCKKIVEEKLGGEIRVSNHSYIYKTQAYVGTRFCIEIPKN